MSTTKRDLILNVSKATGLLKKDVAQIIQMTLDGIADEIAAGNTVELRRFGVFEVVVRRSRKGRNPRQPENEVIIPQRAMVKFRAGNSIKKQVEKLDPKEI
jgi:nucleoid DNA-binding protein